MAIKWHLRVLTTGRPTVVTVSILELFSCWCPDLRLSGY